MRQTRSLFTRPAFALLFALTLVVVASAIVLSAVRWIQDRRHLATGAAQWIWLTKNLKEPQPLHFFASREFDWIGETRGPLRALLFVDRRSVLFLNGVRVGAAQQKPGDPLRAYDVTGRVHIGRNRVEIEAESPDGAGGILFALKLPGGEPMVVSDGNWRVAPSREELRAGGAPAAIWGRPPMYPWGYPALR